MNYTLGHILIKFLNVIHYLWERKSFAAKNFISKYYTSCGKYENSYKFSQGGRKNTSENIEIIYKSKYLSLLLGTTPLINFQKYFPGLLLPSLRFLLAIPIY